MTRFEPIQEAEVLWRNNTLYAPHFNDIYFSDSGGIQEAKHVFIDANNLIARWQKLASEKSPHFIIAETGFGTGLNVLLAWSYWKKYAPLHATLHVYSCEKFPLSHEDLSGYLQFFPEIQDEAHALLESYPILTPGFHRMSFEDGRVNITLMLGDALIAYQQLLICGDTVLEAQLRTFHVDAWFLDGFAPAKNPDMWQEALFVVLGKLSKLETTASTYTVASSVRRGLKAIGFDVQKIKGYGRKREMLVAHYEHPCEVRSKRYTPWHVMSPKAAKKRRAIVLGGGLAGCFTANALARRGWQVTILDREASVGSGASGIRRGLLSPKISAFASPLHSFLLQAYLFARRSYQKMFLRCPMGNLSGLLQLALDVKDEHGLDAMHVWLAHYPQLGVLVDALDASAIAGIALQSRGLFIPGGGWIDAPKVCDYLLQIPTIQWVGEQSITDLYRDQGLWHAGSFAAETLVIANGYQACQFEQTNHLALKPVFGQTTDITSNTETLRLKVPLCAKGHITPVIDGVHCIGATYQGSRGGADTITSNNANNLARLRAFPTESIWSNDVVGQWEGIRATTSDYFPIVGPAPNARLFQQSFAALASDPNRFIPFPGAYYEGLYLCTAFGSRGLATIPLCAEWLAAFMSHEPGCMPRVMEQSISPARFLRRDIIRG